MQRTQTFSEFAQKLASSFPNAAFVSITPVNNLIDDETGKPLIAFVGVWTKGAKEMFRNGVFNDQRYGWTDNEAEITSFCIAVGRNNATQVDIDFSEFGDANKIDWTKTIYKV